MFEVSGGGVGSNKNTVPRLHLEPPHYDGIQCLALNEGVLFSGSRDTSIKKWHLNSQSIPQVCFLLLQLIDIHFMFVIHH